MHDRSTPASEQPVAEELAALRRELATVQTRLDRVTRRPARRRRFTRLLPLGIVALMVALVPLTALAVNPFTDLTGGPHDGNIDAIFNAGITTGCDATSYCPTGNVTREEMASFLARTAGLGTNKPVANAARLATTNPVAGGTTYAANDLVRVARGQSASNIDLTTGTLTEVATLNFTAPTAGFVLVTAVVTANADVPGTCPCEIEASLTNGTTSSRTASNIVQDTATANDEASATVTHVYPVVAGPQTITVRAQRDTGTATLSVGATVTGIFVPFGSTGAGTLGVDEPTTQPDGDQP